MRTLRPRLALIALFVLLIVTAFLTAPRTAAATIGRTDVKASTLRALELAHGPSESHGALRPLSPATLLQLARARRATAKYHDVDNAIADGYVDVNLYTPGEGFHFVNESLIDTTFDPARPEVLLYATRRHGTGLKLVAVEYLSPDAFPPPEGFKGDADVWEAEPPFPVWVLNAWIWLHNPDGIFTFANPRVP